MIIINDNTVYLTYSRPELVPKHALNSLKGTLLITVSVNINYLLLRQERYAIGTITPCYSGYHEFHSAVRKYCLHCVIALTSTKPVKEL